MPMPSAFLAKCLTVRHPPLAFFPRAGDELRRLGGGGGPGRDGSGVGGDQIAARRQGRNQHRRRASRGSRFPGCSRSAGARSKRPARAWRWRRWARAAAGSATWSHRPSFLITLAKWMPAVACAGSGKWMSSAAASAARKRVGGGDVGQGIALAHGDGGRDLGDVGHRGGDDMAAPGELVDQRAAQDHHVGRLARQQLVAHGADGAEGAVDRAAGLGFEGRPDPFDRPCAAPPLRIRSVFTAA